MNIFVDKNPVAFLNAAELFLFNQEAKNNFLLSIALALAKGPMPKTPPIFLRAVANKKTVACALHTEAQGLALTEGPDEALRTIASALKRQAVTPSIVMGPMPAVQTFVDEWSRIAATPSTLLIVHQMYQLSRLKFPPASNGELIAAKVEQTKFVEEWTLAFAKEALPDDVKWFDHFKDSLKGRILAEDIFFWKSGTELVAMAWLMGATQRTVRVSMVYTPPKYRRRGFAGSVVAHVSDLALKSGKKWCVLFADEANATSNKLYRNLGYEPAGEWRDYQLVP